jgi:peptide/nickel transport system substrate-binding protein
MKRTAYRLLAISSAALMLSAAAQARTRPRYGETLRVETRTAVSEYEGAPDLLSGLVFETLVNIDDSGKLMPSLATYWSTPNGGSRWEFLLRSNVQYHDGSPMTPISVAKSLAQAQIPGCKLLTASNGVIVDCDQPQSDLPATLARPHYAIAAQDKDGKAIGTGPSRIARREAGVFSLQADDEYWGGRAYPDAIELTTGRSTRDQMTDFSLDRADVIEVGSEQLRRAQQDRVRLDVSRPSETVLLLVNSSKPELRDTRLRQALSLAIDRASIQSVIFQRQGEVASSLLPNWLTGYAFLFPSVQDVARARQLRTELGPLPAITIAYDPDDALERLIAERVALNVRDAGITMNAVTSSTSTSADIRIARATVASLNPAVALNALVARFDIMPPVNSSSLEKLYADERAALQTFTAIPLVHVPSITAVKDRVRNWTSTATGEWRFDDVWLAPKREVRP